MQTDYISKIKSWLKQSLDEERYIHSVATAKTAEEIAQIVGYDREKAYFTGLVHDCAKNLTTDEQLALISKGWIKLENGEKENKKVLHAPAGAVLMKEKFGIGNKEIFDAIRWHTIGRLGMSKLEKIVFLADKIEPATRNKYDYNRRMALLREKNGLEKNILECYAYTIKSLVERKLTICPKTIDIYNEYLKFSE